MYVLWILRWNQMGNWLKQWDGFCEDSPSRESLPYSAHQIGKWAVSHSSWKLKKKRTRCCARSGNTPAENTWWGAVGVDSASLLIPPPSTSGAQKVQKGQSGVLWSDLREPAAAPSTDPFTPQRSCCSRTTVDAWRRSCDRADGLTGGRGRVADPPSSEEQVGSPATTTHAAMQTQEAATRGSDEELMEVLSVVDLADKLPLLSERICLLMAFFFVSMSPAALVSTELQRPAWVVASGKTHFL